MEDENSRIIVAFQYKKRQETNHSFLLVSYKLSMVLYIIK